MSPFDQSRTPQNLVSNIVGEKIYLKNVSAQTIDAIKEMGAFQVAFGVELVWMIQCVDDDEVTETLRRLNQFGFLFVGSPSGYPAADVFGILLEKRRLNDRFKEVQWRGPGDWFIIERS